MSYKRRIYLALIFICLYLFGFVWTALFAALFLGLQYVWMVSEVRRYREREITYVLYGTEEMRARAEEVARGHLDAVVMSTTQCNPWVFLVVSTTLVFVADSLEETDPFLVWLEDEMRTRIQVSRSSGWAENIVYTMEGIRRKAFCRIRYHTTWPRLDTLLEAACAQRVADPWEKPPPCDPKDLPSFGLFLEYLLEGSFVQYEFEAHRNRPSPLRTNLWHLFLAAVAVHPTAAAQLARTFLEWVKGFFPSWEILWISTRTLPFLSHVPATAPLALAAPPIFRSQWGELDLVKKNDNFQGGGAQWIVNKGFRLDADLGRKSPTTYPFEYASLFTGVHAIIPHPDLGMPGIYAVLDQDTLSFLQGLKPGASFTLEDGLARGYSMEWLVQSQLLLPAENVPHLSSSELQRMRDEFAHQGWTVFNMEALVAWPAWNALRRYYQELRPWIRDVAHAKTWNDEPVLRPWNILLTKWMERIVRKPLIQSALTLSIFVEPGTPGFLYHTDTSPPFDITLDFVIDHQGPNSRPLYFCSRNQTGGWLPSVSRLDLKPTEAVIFRGAELTHWGGNLARDSAHIVGLLTWQYGID